MKKTGTIVLVLLGIMVVSYAISASFIDEATFINQEPVNVLQEARLTSSASTAIIESVAADITIHQGEEVSATLSGTSTQPEEFRPILHVEEEGNSVHIWVEHPRKAWSFGMDNLDLVVVVPETEKTIIKTVSGEIETDRAIEECIIESVSGDIDIPSIHGKCSLSSVSGDIKIHQAQDEIKITTTSGDIQLRGAKDTTTLKSVSGDVSASYEKVTGAHTIHTTSGIVEIETPYDAAFGVDASSVSGDISTTKELTMKSFEKKHIKGYVKSEENSFVIETVSGKIVIG